MTKRQRIRRGIPYALFGAVVGGALGAGTLLSLRSEGGVDWSQFLPDMILTVPTALAIGFWLWRIQDSAQRKSEEQNAIANWTVARTRFSEIVTDYLPTDIKSPVMVERGLEPFVDLADRFPNLAAWALAAKIEPELQNVRKVLVNLPELRKSSPRLVEALQEAAFRHTDQVSASKLAGLAFWMLLNVEVTEGLTDDLRTRTAHEVRANQSEVEAVVFDEEVTQAWLHYVWPLDNVRAGYNKLYQSLSMRGPFHYSMEAEEWEETPSGC